MSLTKRGAKKPELHPRNRNRQRYDLKALALAVPDLENHFRHTPSGETSIDFSDPEAVRLLNKAILKHDYGIAYWDFPKENLCPPVPGSAEYIHHIADLISECNGGRIPRGNRVIGLDIGIGASCIYPIIGVVEYGWQFIGSDINPQSINYAEKIVELNPSLTDRVICKLQENANSIFRGIVPRKIEIDVTICNPPFHASKEELQKENKRKVQHLTREKGANPSYNFSGNNSELLYKGGEYQFIKNMIEESAGISKSVFWFSTLVSKQSNLKKIYPELEKQHPALVRTLEIKTGNKISRILAWTFMTRTERKDWQKRRWK